MTGEELARQRAANLMYDLEEQHPGSAKPLIMMTLFLGSLLIYGLMRAFA